MCIRDSSTRAKRWLVVLSVAVNLGMLAYFKYTNFLIDISNQMFGQGFMQFQNIFLPVGISFFVFQSMSYTCILYTSLGKADDTLPLRMMASSVVRQSPTATLK